MYTPRNLRPLPSLALPTPATIQPAIGSGSVEHRVRSDRGRLLIGIWLAGATRSALVQSNTVFGRIMAGCRSKFASATGQRGRRVDFQLVPIVIRSTTDRGLTRLGVQLDRNRYRLEIYSSASSTRDVTELKFDRLWSEFYRLRPKFDRNRFELRVRPGPYRILIGFRSDSITNTATTGGRFRSPIPRSLMIEI